MLSDMEKVNIIAEKDRKKREALIDNLSETEAKQLLKDLFSIMRQMHNTAIESAK